jgi:hypothetical protein
MPKVVGVGSHVSDHVRLHGALWIVGLGTFRALECPCGWTAVNVYQGWEARAQREHDRVRAKVFG